jgi:hypothetical protein
MTRLVSAPEPTAPQLADDTDLGLQARGTNRGLVRRLLDGTLRPPERADYERVQQIAALEEEGKKYPEIAEALNLDTQYLYRWVQTAKYRLFRRHVSERSAMSDDVTKRQRQDAERRRFDANAHKALDYFDQAFARHAKNNAKAGIRAGDFKDLDRAERAAKIVAGAQGWLEPIPTREKPRELSAGVIQAQLSAMRAADKKELVVRIETKTIEISAKSEEAGIA